MLNSAVINLMSLRYNANEIKKSLGCGVKFCAVVKADGYGHGAEAVANALHDIVDCYAVAIVEEGISLRQSGIRKDILVLIPPFKSDLERAVRYNLTLAVCDLKTAKDIAREAKKQRVKIKIHVKVNTGMNRQGVRDLNDLDEICDYIVKEGSLVLEGVFSHFSRPENKRSRNNAVDKFLLAINCVKGYNKKIISHISASGGFLSGVEMDMVRIGIMLYGYTPFKTNKIKLKPVMKLTTPIITVRRFKKGETALYGDKKIKKSGNYALIRFGYADGLFRRNIRGQHANRCMDATLTEKSDKKQNVAVLTDADAVAKKYKTISYEVLCKVGGRAERIYRR